MLKLKPIALYRAAAGVLVDVGMPFYLWMVNAPRGMELIAEKDIPIYRDENYTRNTKQALQIAFLKQGQNARVVHCYYTKDYQIVVISLPDGRKGYVLDGDYVLMRHKKKVVC